MPTYRYRAVHKSGQIRTGTMGAGDEAALARQLGQWDCELIAARTSRRESRPTASRPTTRTRPSSLFRSDKTLRAISGLLTQVRDLMETGIPLTDALPPFAASLPPGPFRAAVQDIIQRLNHGQELGAAFAAHGHFFDPVFVAMLRAGAAGGDLIPAWERLDRHVQFNSALTRKWRRALRYPLFLIALTFAVFCFMLLVVVPEVTAFLYGLDVALPASTRLLIASAGFAQDALPYAVGLIGGGAVLLWGWRHGDAKARLITDRALLHLPVIGALIRAGGLARFAGSLGALLDSGLDMRTSLEEASPTWGNSALIDDTRRLLEQILSGVPLSTAAGTLFPLYALQMIRMAETTGHLPRALDRIARTAADDVAARAEAAIGLIEPALTLLVGAMLAWIVMAVLGPVYSSLDHLGGGMM